MQYIDEFIEYTKDKEFFPNPEHEPKQFMYQYKLFLLEQGYYGIKPTSKVSTNTDSEMVRGCGTDSNGEVSESSDGGTL